MTTPAICSAEAALDVARLFDDAQARFARGGDADDMQQNGARIAPFLSPDGRFLLYSVVLGALCYLMEMGDPIWTSVQHITGACTPTTADLDPMLILADQLKGGVSDEDVEVAPWLPGVRHAAARDTRRADPRSPDRVDDGRSRDVRRDRLRAS